MNFANLTPAERLKASGLIGLIVVVLFFVVYTMMGQLGGKKTSSAPPPGGSPSEIATDVPTPPVASPTGAPVNPDQPFPIGDAKSHHASAQNQDLYQLDDPFKPLREKPQPIASAASNMNGGHAPSVGISPASQSRALPTWGGGPSRPAAFGGLGNAFARPFGADPEKADPPKYMPEIQVVGVVHGRPSVATLKIEGHVVTARPGDLLARGHRLVTVNDEGVVIRAHGELTALRVGAGVNSSKEVAAAEG